MKVNALFPIAFKNAPDGLKRKYCDVIRDVLNARAELGFKNDIYVVLDNIHEIFMYIASDLDSSTIKLYARVINDIAKWLNKDVRISFEEFLVCAEQNSSDQEDDGDNMREAALLREEENDDGYDDDSEEEDDSDEDDESYIENPATVGDLDCAVIELKSFIQKLSWSNWSCAAFGYLLGAASITAYAYTLYYFKASREAHVGVCEAI